MGETEHEQAEREQAEQDAPEAPGAEEEQGDEEATHEGAEPEPEPEPAPEAQAMSEASIEKAMASLARSATTWRNAVSRNLGEDAQMLVPCELCLPEIPGFHWPADVEQPRGEVHTRLLAVLKTPEGPQYRPAVNARECDECDGFGRVLSGSKLPECRLIQCTGCGGKGYRVAGAAASNGSTETIGEPVPVGAAGDAPPAEDADAWGVPKLLETGLANPNYGKMPQYWDHAYPIGRVG